MKHKVLYILLVVVLMSAAQPSQASFYVKKASSTVIATSSTTAEGNTLTTTKTSKLNERLSVLTPPPFRNWQSRGWVGEVALLLGILGFVVPFFAIGALLFGFMGVSRRNRNRGLAAAGLALGVTVLILSIFFGFTGWGLF